MKKNLSLIFLFIIIVFSSCNDDDIGDYSCEINLKIENESGENLIGEENLYMPSQISITQNDVTYEATFSFNESENYISCSTGELINFESDKPFYLTLSPNLTIRLDLSYGQDPTTSCIFGYYLKNIKYLDKSLESDGDIYTLVL